jgi:hypothetical protein
MKHETPEQWAARVAESHPLRKPPPELILEEQKPSVREVVIFKSRQVGRSFTMDLKDIEEALKR